MPPFSPLHSLPAEILLEIFGHLPHEDTRTFLQVNSYFRRIAQPHAYRHGIMTKFGLHFPGATHPYPFSDEAVTKEKRAWIAKQVQLVDVVPHSELECTSAGSLLRHPPSPFALDVLRLRLHPGCKEGFCVPDQGDKLKTKFTCWSRDECPFLLATLKGFPGQCGSIISRSVSCFDQSDTPYLYYARTRRRVSVLSCRPRPEAESSRERRWPEIGPLSVSGLEFDHLEVIFWTTRPGEAWIPPFETYADGRSGSYSPNDESVWATLAAVEVDVDVKQITVVNAGAIVPPGSSKVDHETKMQEEHSLCRELQDKRAECFLSELRERRPGGPTSQSDPIKTAYEFITMEEWVCRDNWEDVFTRSEMEPWLRALREGERVRQTSEDSIPSS